MESEILKRHLQKFGKLPSLRDVINGAISPSAPPLAKIVKHKDPKKIIISKSWQVEELESFFKDIKLPDVPIKLNIFTTILNPALFVDSHLDIVRAQNGKPTYKPYLDRLIKFKDLINNNLN